MLRTRLMYSIEFLYQKNASYDYLDCVRRVSSASYKDFLKKLKCRRPCILPHSMFLLQVSLN